MARRPTGTIITPARRWCVARTGPDWNKLSMRLVAARLAVQAAACTTTGPRQGGDAPPRTWTTNLCDRALGEFGAGTAGKAAAGGHGASRGTGGRRGRAAGQRGARRGRAAPRADWAAREEWEGSEALA